MDGNRHSKTQTQPDTYRKRKIESPTFESCMWQVCSVDVLKLPCVSVYQSKSDSIVETFSSKGKGQRFLTDQPLPESTVYKIVDNPSHTLTCAMPPSNTHAHHSIARTVVCQVSTTKNTSGTAVLQWLR